MDLRDVFENHHFYSVAAIDCVAMRLSSRLLSLLRSPLLKGTQVVPQPLPNQSTLALIDPHKFMPTSIEGAERACGTLHVNEGQTNSNNFAGVARRSRKVAAADGLIRRPGTVGATPKIRRDFNDFAEQGDVVAASDVFACDPRRDSRHGLGPFFGRGLHGSAIVKK